MSIKPNLLQSRYLFEEEKQPYKITLYPPVNPEITVEIYVG